jgi:hypothetical protein
MWSEEIYSTLDLLKDAVIQNGRKKLIKKLKKQLLKKINNDIKCYQKKNKRKSVSKIEFGNNNIVRNSLYKFTSSDKIDLIKSKNQIPELLTKSQTSIRTSSRKSFFDTIPLFIQPNLSFEPDFGELDFYIDFKFTFKISNELDNLESNIIIYISDDQHELSLKKLKILEKKYTNIVVLELYSDASPKYKNNYTHIYRAYIKDNQWDMEINEKVFADLKKYLEFINQRID